ncbi:hypothetical protein, partial [Leucobacter celer]|uniref:hypothetical protein n=1 Tax=Leucobacter celer TaxID=668625 RepID=UPI0019D365F5
MPRPNSSTSPPDSPQTGTDGETSRGDGGGSSGSGGDADPSSRYTVNFAPSDLTSDQIDAL